MKKIISSFLLLSILLLLLNEPILAKDSNVIDDENINKINEFIYENMRKNNISGAILSITKGDKVYYSKGYGRKSDNSKITNKTPMPIASLSKSFTALAVLKLSEEYNINIDETYISFFKDLKIKDNRIKNITIRHLINHTSGLNDKVNPDMTRNPQYESLSEINKSLENIYLEYDPGTKYSYHNPNYQFLAYLIEKVSGISFEEYMKEKIFVPLGMNNTFSVKSTREFKNHSNIPKGHYTLFGFKMNVYEPSWFVNGPAGIISNADDMGKWLLEKRNISILKRKENKDLFYKAGKLGTYGTGHNVYKDDELGNIISSSGIFWSYKSEQTLLMEKDLAVTITFDKGLNVFTNYTIFTKGVLYILLGNPISKDIFNNIFLEIVILILILTNFIWRYFNIKKFNKLIGKDYKKAKKSTLLSGVILFLIATILLLLPRIITFIGGGRVIHLIGIWMSMSSIIVLLILLLLSSCISFIYKLYKIKKV